MKKVLKRTLCLLLVLVMTLSIAACGGSDQPAAGGNAGTPAADGQTSGNGDGQGRRPNGDPNRERDHNARDADLEPQYGGEFHMVKTTSPATLFPQKYATNGGGYLGACLETLCYQNPTTNEIEPRLVEEFTFDMEGDGSITAKLREGVMFHDGSELTSEVVKWNYDFMKKSGLGDTIYDVDVEVVDDYNFIMTFPEYHIDAPTILVKTVNSKYTYDTMGEEYLENHPVGTGAFVFVEYVPDQKLVYERFDNYWQEGYPYLDRYVVDIISDAAAATAAFLNGDVNALEQSNSDQCAMIEAAGFEDIHFSTFNNSTVYGFAPNSRVVGDPWYDVNVRQAVMLYGINYEALRALAGKDLAVLNHNFDNPGSLIYEERFNEAYVYDKDKALKMLADAGYPDGFDTTIYCRSTFKSVATTLQTLLADLNIRADVQLVTASDPRLFDGVTPGVFISVATSSWDIITKPMTNTYNQNGGTYGKNILFSDEYQELFNQVVVAKDYETRGTLGKELMQKFFIDECLYAVCYSKESNVYVNGAHNTGLDIKLPSPYQTWVD